MNRPDDPRYERQRRLAEVGQAGQEKICRAEVRVKGEEGTPVELEYLKRAGVSRLDVSALEAPGAFAHAAAFRFAESRAVAAGAWRALASLRSALGITGP